MSEDVIARGLQPRCGRCYCDPCRCPDARYREEMGREPPELPEDDPLGWQWDWRGTRGERERLKDELYPAPTDEPPAVHPEQETLL